MTFVDRVTSILIENRTVVVPVLLLTILIAGAGVTHLEEDNTLQSFEVGSTEERKLDYIDSNFSAGAANETVTQVVITDDNVLDKESLLTALEVQQEIRSKSRSLQLCPQMISAMSVCCCVLPSSNKRR